MGADGTAGRCSVTASATHWHRCPARSGRSWPSPAAVCGSSAIGTLLVYVAYATGIALVVGVLAVAVALASGVVIDRMRRVLPTSTGSAARSGPRSGCMSPTTAGTNCGFRRIGRHGSGHCRREAHQGQLAGWVYRLGGWTWLLVLSALVASAAAGWAWRRRRHTPGRGTTRLDSPHDYLCSPMGAGAAAVLALAAAPPSWSPSHPVAPPAPTSAPASAARSR